MRVSLVAVGKDYNNQLTFALDFFKEYDICLLGDIERDDVFYFEKYNKVKFSYFDKLYFSLSMVDKFKRDVFYVDVNKISDVFLDFEKNKLFYHRKHWPFGNTLQDYLMYDFFNPLIENWVDSDVDFTKLPAIGETELFFNKKLDVKSIIKHLEIIQPIFREMSTTKPTYTGYDNAEGIALSYALKKCNII